MEVPMKCYKNAFFDKKSLHGLSVKAFCHRCLNSFSCSLYTIVFTCRTDRPNSSARGSKQQPSQSRRFRMYLFLSLWMYSFIRLIISEFLYSFIFSFSLVPSAGRYLRRCGILHTRNYRPSSGDAS